MTLAGVFRLCLHCVAPSSDVCFVAGCFVQIEDDDCDVDDDDDDEGFVVDDVLNYFVILTAHLFRDL